MQDIATRENTPVSGSQTVVATEQPNQPNQEHAPVILHLQVVANHDERRVTWDEGVIDNENMGKKSSKGILLQWIC
jgi:hypothetical protein